MEATDLFASNGACADIGDEEWLGGWVSVVGGVNGRPTAQQFNKVFNTMQQFIVANKKSIEEAGKTASDALPDKSFNRDNIVDKIADGKIISNLNAGLLEGHKAEYFAKATDGFALYTDTLDGIVHKLVGNGNSHGYVYLNDAFSSSQRFTVNGNSVAVYAGGDAVEEIAAGHWYAFTYDSANAVIDFFGMGTQKYMKKEGGTFSGDVYFGSTTYYAKSSGNAKFNNLTCSGEITGSKVYNAVYNDYAELFPRGEHTEPGDIIALDTESTDEQYIKAVRGSHIVGVHTDEFAHLIGGEEPPNGLDYLQWNLPKYIPIGLVGRCRVKVLGYARKGDYIIPSESFPGVGIAVECSTAPDDAIGFAVENSFDTGIHRVRVKLRG